MPDAVIRFGRFELQPQERRLLADGEPVPLGGRALDVLALLAARPGSLVTKNELLDQVWRGLVVEEGNLAVQVSGLRKVVGGDVIATVPGRGYRFTAAVESQGAPVARTAPPPALTPAPLVGRERDLAALREQVRRHRLVTLLGAGGVGKSSLARHLLDAETARHRHGGCWVELGPLGEPAQVAGQVAAALGVPARGADALSALATAAAGLELLLVLDNAEHLLDFVAELAQRLHAAAPGLHLLVTSQAPLALRDEQLFRLQPLAVPGAELPAAQALEYGAVALFAARAHAADTRFALDDASAPTVIALVRALDGLPLAIELAAARLRSLGLQALTASLGQRLHLLTRNADRMAPARQQTLRAALTWSHGLLAPREQTVLRRMAVFVGSADLDLVREVAADAGIDGWDVIDALAVLVDRSLVDVFDVADGAAPRYRLLDSPHALALEQLQAAGEDAALRDRHAAAMARRAERACDERWDGSIGVQALEQRDEPDTGNALAAFRWSLACGHTEHALTLAAQLLPAFQALRFEERRELRDRCAALLHDGVPALVRWRIGVELAPTWNLSDNQRGLQAAQQALAAARELQATHPDRWRLCHSLRALALQALRAQRSDLARAALDEEAALVDAAWPPIRMTQHYGARAQWKVLAERDNAGSLPLWRRALALLQEAGGDGKILRTVIAQAELDAGDSEAALRSGYALLDELAGARDESARMPALVVLTRAHLLRGEAAGARAALQQAWPLLLRAGILPFVSDLPARLAARELRDEDAARLVGFAYAVLERHRMNAESGPAPESQRSLDRLGTERAERLIDEGRLLRDEDVAAIAFRPANVR